MADPGGNSAAAELRALLLLGAAAGQGHGQSQGQASLFQALQQLRDSGDPSFLFLRTVLELTAAGGSPASSPPSADDEQLLFHCVGGLRHVLLHRRAAYADDFVGTVRDFLLALGLAPSLPRTVSNSCLGCAASLWKRDWVGGGDGATGAAANAGGIASPPHSNGSTGSARGDGGGNGAGLVENAEAQAHLVQMMMTHARHPPRRLPTHAALFQLLESIVPRPFNTAAAGEQQQQAAATHAASQAATFLSLLLGEISGTSTGGAYNLPLEQHRRIHAAFESAGDGLDATLRVAMAGLGGAVRVLTEANGNGGSGSANNGAGSGSSGTGTCMDRPMIELCAAVVGLVVDTLSWEFGAGSHRVSFLLTDGGGGTATLIRPPERWREYLIRPDFLGAVFSVYTAVRTQPHGQQCDLGHRIRQLLLMLSSVTGIIYESREQKSAYAGFLVDGCLSVLALLHQEAIGDPASYDEDVAEVETIDLCAMVSRLVATFKIEGLSTLPSFGNLLGAVNAVGNDLLQKSLSECERARGDTDDMEGIQWRSEALGHLLDAAVLLADDPWISGGDMGGNEAVRGAAVALASSLSSLYGTYVNARTKMAKLEEHYITSHAEDLDEVREEISEVATEEEMTAASSLGRLNVANAITSLAALLDQCLPHLKALFEAQVQTVTTAQGEISPDAAALLEEARLLVVCITHLLTDDNVGEEPMIPASIVRACSNDEGLVSAIGACVTSLMQLAEYQASLVSVNAEDPRLSPLLAKTLLWFFDRWAPGYVLVPTATVESDAAASSILRAWSTQESASTAVTFCLTLCLHYHCYWPQEHQVQEAATSLTLKLAKRGSAMRALMVKSTSFEKVVAMHSCTTSLLHTCTTAEVHSAAANAQAMGQSLEQGMIKGYCRLPYEDRAKILTGLCVASSDAGDIFSHACLMPVKNAFSSLLQALHNKQLSPHDVNATEMTSLCVALYGGIANVSGIAAMERIPIFITPSLQPLSDLMVHYADELHICEALLGFFRDYAEGFMPVLDRDECLSLFHASSGLLRSYSTAHCKSRSVTKASTSSLEDDLEEEQNYSDISTAISLLIHLSTKDFIDICSTSDSNAVESNQVTDMIFFGLQQILPLMTQGLLQYPALCSSYFSLVSFMMETYPAKVCALPFDLFNALLDSMLFGMSHSDTFVAKSSLRGLGGLAREHLKSKALGGHLAAHPDIIDTASTRVLQDVVFQSIIWDRLEPAASALLPLAAIDMGRFANVVSVISSQFGSLEKAQRFQAAFQKLMKPEVISKVASGGYEGRMNRLKFKAAFDEFVKDIHSFLILA